jgi:hypothetical protein|tara:strand:+ start:57 stop:341 length:285 start_codon:yes stop_codon:yes gene_type:complete
MIMNVTKFSEAASVLDNAMGDDDDDMVNSPSHYNFAGVECIDAIRAATGEEGFSYYLQGNIMKYLWRYKYKNGLEDLKKAEWYLNVLIEDQDDS